MLAKSKHSWEPFCLFELRKNIEISLIGRERSLILSLAVFGGVLLAAFTGMPSVGIASSFGQTQQGRSFVPASSPNRVLHQAQSLASDETIEGPSPSDASNIPEPIYSATDGGEPSDAESEKMNGRSASSDIDATLTVEDSLKSSFQLRPSHSQRTSDMFEVPQSVCPGSPSLVALGKGNPSPKVTPQVMKHLDMIAESIAYSPESPDPSKVYLNSTCLFVTKPCGHTSANVQGRWIMNKLKITTEEDLQSFAERLLDIDERGLGSCAIVGNSDNLMRDQRGAEIDAHDTIFRHNTPTAGYEKYVGARSSIVYMKTKYTKSPPKGSINLAKVELALAELKDIAEVPRSMRSNGKHIFLRASASNHFARERRKLYSMVGAGRKHPSGGWARPINLLASKLCTRIDVYGFSGNMGGKYFARRDKVRPAHLMAFEHWSYRYLMSKKKLCVYGD